MQEARTCGDQRKVEHGVARQQHQQLFGLAVWYAGAHPDVELRQQQLQSVPAAPHPCPACMFAKTHSSVQQSAACSIAGR